jgi:hypothetical protein
MVMFLFVVSFARCLRARADGTTRSTRRRGTGAHRAPIAMRASTACRAVSSTATNAASVTPSLAMTSRVSGSRARSAKSEPCIASVDMAIVFLRFTRM